LNRRRLAGRARLEELPAFLDFIEAGCRDAGASPGASADLRLAVEEACANIMSHGYRGEPGPLTVEIASDDRQIVVRITDRAPPFRPDLVPPPDLASDWRARHIGGLGWHLINSVMDEVRHEALGEQGNVLTLVKRLGERTTAPGGRE